MAQDFHRHAVGPANLHRQVHHRATVCVNSSDYLLFFEQAKPGFLQK